MARLQRGETTTGPTTSEQLVSRTSGLPAKQRRFVEEYLIDLNGQNAAERAGYAPGSAKVTASRLLTRANVKAAVEAGMARRQERTEITQDRVLEELQCLAFSNITDYVVTDDGQVELAEGAHRDAMRAVQSIKRKVRSHGNGANRRVEHEVEIKFWDKLMPLKLAGRHTGLFPNEVKADVGVGTLADILKMAHEIQSK